MADARAESDLDFTGFTEHPDRVVRVVRRHKPDETAAFCFGDDEWFLIDLLEPHEARWEARVGFAGLPPWLRDEAKRYIAHLWLRTWPKAIEIQQNMVALRDLGRLLQNFSGAPVDLRLRHSREFSRRYCEFELSGGTYQRTRRLLNRFITFVQRRHPEATELDFKVEFPRVKTLMPEYLPLEKSKDAKIEATRLAMIIDACTADVRSYMEAKEGYLDPLEDPAAYRAKSDRARYLRKKQGLPPVTRRPPLQCLLARAVKAQAVILAICTGRRAAAVCNTLVDVRATKVKWVNEAGQPEEGVSVRFRERKIRNVDEEVYCPDVFGELALRAIETAKDLTKDLRRFNPGWKDYLFIVPAKLRKAARVLKPRQINEYLNGEGDNPQGIRQRYDISGKKITTHNFRHTRATAAWLGGMRVHEVAYDLGHASGEMTARHYIVGNEESRRRLQFLMDHGALGGALEDLVGGREVVRTKLSPRHVEIMKRQGRVLTPTRYGYCALPATSGPCPTANPCYIGPGSCGEGCEHHVTSPDALPALREDREALEASISACEGEAELKAWAENQRNQLVIITREIARAEGLRRRVGHCEKDGAICECKNGTGNIVREGRDGEKTEA